MLAFIQWCVVCVVAFVGYMFFAENISFPELRKYNILAAIIAWCLVFSPFYFEFADWRESVPVTFSDDGKVIRHNFGVFTVPFITKYANMPTGESFRDLVVATGISKNREKARVFSYSVTATIGSPDKYYGKMEQREKSSIEIIGELEQIADSTLRAFIESHPTDIKHFPEPFDYSLQERSTDSLRNVFNKWLETHRRNDDGVKISFDRLYGG